MKISIGDSMTKTLYTIGYSGFLVEEFIDALKKNNINAVIDVRSSPYSQFFSDYNKEPLEKTLKKEGIFYRNYSKEFGARQEDRSYYNAEGYLDFEVFAKSKQFSEGVNRLCASMEKGFVFALMCAEKKPIDCHRTILVARAFYRKGYKIVHICANGRTETQEDIHCQLLERYYPDRNQFNFFREDEDDEVLLLKAYKKRNKEIGYKLEDDN